MGRPELETRPERAPLLDTLPRSAVDPRPSYDQLFAGKYALRQELGSGGMGAVYEAENAWTGRRVAIKMLKRELLESAELVARFLQEGRATSRIEHPNVVQILDMGQEDKSGTLFMVQEFLVGRDLRSRLDDGRLDLAEALDVMLPIMGALAAAHAKGVVHRDVKPGNIVLSLDASSTMVPKLIDFGIAKLLSEGAPTEKSSLTQTFHGSMMGTPAYMPPEQITGDLNVDGSADVWSVGAVLYELLAGRRPFEEQEMSRLVRRILSERAAPLEEVPDVIAKIVARALEPDRDLRFKSMQQMLDMLLQSRLMTADRLGIRLAAKHQRSLPRRERAFEPRPDPHVRIRCDSWPQTLEWVTTSLAQGGFFAPLTAKEGTETSLLLELPDGLRSELLGRAAGATTDGTFVRLEPGQEVDLLLLEQVARTRVGPTFVAANASQSGAVEDVLGIDFGTSYTSAAVVADGRAFLVVDEAGRSLFPSIVSFAEDGRTAVGWEARRALLANPGRTISGVKRLLGRTYSDPLLAGYLASLPYPTSQAPNDTVMMEIADPPVTPIQVAALLIENAKRVAERRLNRTFARAVLSVPVAYGVSERSALERAAKRAGLEVLGLVEEPIAGAIASDVASERPELVAVYDFGGGTFDFSLLRMGVGTPEVLSTAGDDWLGGDDFDLALAQAVADGFWQKTRVDLRQRIVEWQRLLFACERAKRRLSFGEEAEVRVDAVVEHPQRMDLRRAVTRAELAKMGRNLLGRSMEVVAGALAKGKVTADQVSRVVVTGGMSRSPIVRAELSRFFGRPIETQVNPEEAVCLGAAIHGARTIGQRADGAARG